MAAAEELAAAADALALTVPLPSSPPPPPPLPGEAEDEAEEAAVAVMDCGMGESLAAPRAGDCVGVCDCVALLVTEEE